MPLHYFNVGIFSFQMRDENESLPVTPAKMASYPHESLHKITTMILNKGRHQKKKSFKWALPVKLRPPPPCLNGQGGPFSGRQKRHFSAYYRIKLKLILIIKMIISVMKIVILKGEMYIC